MRAARIVRSIVCAGATYADMAKLIMLVLSCAGVLAAPPAPQHQERVYQQPGPSQLQQLNSLKPQDSMVLLPTYLLIGIFKLDYYLDNPNVHQYYNDQQQQHDKQAQVNSIQNGAPSRLETLEPDSEVELIPGAQQPQQPPQQNPVSPNLPGLIPGQRVYIVHMPVPGYRPGTVGGYQPVYVVAAAPGNQNHNSYSPNNYAPNGYQNTLLVDPSGQGISPLLGYPGVQGPGYLLAGGGPLALSRPYDLLYQNPGFGYRQAPGLRLANPQGTVRLAQLIHLQAHPEQAANFRNSAKESSSNVQSSRLTETSESKESNEERKRSARPAPAHPAQYNV